MDFLYQLINEESNISYIYNYLTLLKLLKQIHLLSINYQRILHYHTIKISFVTHFRNFIYTLYTGYFSLIRKTISNLYYIWFLCAVA